MGKVLVGDHYSSNCVLFLKPQESVGGSVCFRTVYLTIMTVKSTNGPET